MANVLLLEDDRDVRRVLERATQIAGHTVVGSLETVSEATTIFTREQVDVLVADVGLSEALMPLLRSLRRTHPTIRVLLISGTDQDTLVERGKIPGHHTFLAKPFKIERYEEALALLLESP